MADKLSSFQEKKDLNPLKENDDFHVLQDKESNDNHGSYFILYNLGCGYTDLLITSYNGYLYHSPPNVGGNQKIVVFVYNNKGSYLNIRFNYKSWYYGYVLVGMEDPEKGNNKLTLSEPHFCYGLDPGSD
jgi:hypothetical protein